MRCSVHHDTMARAAVVLFCVFFCPRDCCSSGGVLVVISFPHVSFAPHLNYLYSESMMHARYRERYNRGTAVYTSSWVAPKADVHSQQRFFYMGQKGEVNVDQAHRGYTVAKDGDGFRSVNPLFMKYTPTDGERVETSR